MLVCWACPHVRFRKRGDPSHASLPRPRPEPPTSLSLNAETQSGVDGQLDRGCHVLRFFFFHFGEQTSRLKKSVQTQQLPGAFPVSPEGVQHSTECTGDQTKVRDTMLYLQKPPAHRCMGRPAGSVPGTGLFLGIQRLTNRGRSSG